MPEVGRLFVGERQVRLGDVDPSGRMRLDALTRYTQDVSNDDTSDGGLADALAWVVRRTVVEVFQPATFGEHFTVSTFCGGLGRRWAERRLSVVGQEGCRYEVATLWVQIDASTGRPRQLSEQFLDLYGEAALGRKVGARLLHPPPPEKRAEVPWPLRAVDFDTLNHLNNASYWAVVEESLAADPMQSLFRATIEYGAGVPPGSQVSIATETNQGSRFLWWLVGDQSPASASITSLAGSVVVAGSRNTLER